MSRKGFSLVTPTPNFRSEIISKKFLLNCKWHNHKVLEAKYLHTSIYPPQTYSFTQSMTTNSVMVFYRLITTKFSFAYKQMCILSLHHHKCCLFEFEKKESRSNLTSILSITLILLLLLFAAMETYLFV